MQASVSTVTTNTNLGNQRVYDDAASYYQWLRWFKNRLTQLEYAQTERALLAEFKPSTKGRYLEIGCGPGTWTKVVAPRCAEVIALDISAKMIEQARNYVGESGNVTFVHTDANDYSIQGELDGIFSFRVVEYINGWQAMLTRVAEHVRPGGCVTICTKTPFSVYRGTGRERWFTAGIRHRLGVVRRRLQGEPPRVDDFWQRYISPRELRAVLESAGFTDFRVVPAIFGLPIFARGTCQYPLVPTFAERPFLWAFEAGRRLATKSPAWLRRLSLIFAESYVLSATKR